MAGNTGFTSVSSEYPQSGSYSAKLGPVGNYGYLQQTIATTAGDYLVQFDLRNLTGLTSNHFEASFGGVALTGAGFPLDNVGAFPYTHFSFLVTVATGSSLLQMGGYKNSGYWFLDNVSVTATAAPVPLPAALWMFAPALGGLGLLGRRKQAA